MGNAVKGTGAILLVIAVAILLSVGGLFLSGVISMGTADFRGNVEKHEKVDANGDYVVAQHDWFYHTCGDVQAKQQNIKELESLGKGYKEEVVANKMQLNEMVSEYNEKAANNYTAGQFREDELPYHIDANQEVESCGTPEN